MIEVEPLSQEHLDAFDPEGEAFIPKDQIGHAAVGVKDGKPLGICMAAVVDDSVVLSLVMSAEGRKFPVSLHRLARQMLAGLHSQGYECLLASAEDRRSAAWLQRLGFTPTQGGGFVKHVGI